MDLKGTISIIVVTAAVFGLIWGVGTLVRKLPGRVVKTVNWIISFTAFASGLASYASGQAVFFYIFLISLVGYFLTISFTVEEK